MAIDFALTDLLQSTAIPIPETYSTRPRQKKPPARSSISNHRHSMTKFYLVDDLSYSSAPDSASETCRPTACTGSLASVLMAKKNSYTVCPNSFVYSTGSSMTSCYNSSASLYLPNTDSSASPSSTSPLSSSPESTFSDLSSDSDDNASFPYMHSNKSAQSPSKSRLSSVTSLSAPDEDHPLSAFFYSKDANGGLLSSDNNKGCDGSAKQPQTSPAPESKKKSFVSNLSESFKKFTKSSSQTTIVPPISYTAFFLSKSSETPEQTVPRDIQLKTFNIKTTPLADHWNVTDFYSSNETEGFSNCRSARASPLFLKLYAIENVAQQKKLIPNIFDMSQGKKPAREQQRQQKQKSMFSFLDDSGDESDEEEDDDDGDCYDEYAYLNTREYIELGDKAKLKLFNHIKLNPRADLPANNNLKNFKYVPLADSKPHNKPNDPLINKESDATVAPWVQFNDVELMSLRRSKRSQPAPKTHGVLKNKVQFTVKGYANTRWIHKS